MKEKIKDGILEFFKHMMSDSNKVMLQNFIGIAAFFMICVAFISNLFWAKPIIDFIYEGMMWIVLGCLGIGAVTAFKGFTGKNKQKDENSDEGK